MAENNPANTSFGGTSIISRISSFKTHRYTVIIQLLDDVDQLSFQFKGNELGQSVLDAVCTRMGITQKDYFGLRYHDQNNYRFWLDLTKPLNKQFKSDHLSFSLRFRFYPRDPLTLKEYVTRYQLIVQLRRDLLHGRLQCSTQQSIKLAALILQAVLGDYDEGKHHPGYVSEYQLMLKQTERLEKMIADLHKDLKGMSEFDAESKFLLLASEIESYGYDPYVIKDSKQNTDLVIGATCRGILVFSKNHLIRSIPWDQLVKLDYTGKELKIYPSRDYIDEIGADTSGNNDLLNVTTSTIKSNESTKSRLSFRSKSTKINNKKEKFKFICPSHVFAKHLWRHLLSQKAFYTEEVAKLVKPMFSKPKIPILFRGSTFKLPTKKVLHEIEKENETLPEKIEQPILFTKYSLPKQISRTEFDVSISSKTNTLKSVKIQDKNRDSIIEVKTTIEKNKQEEPISKAVENNIATSSTPRHSTTNIPAFIYTPTSVENTADPMLNSSVDTQKSTTTTSVRTTADELLRNPHGNWPNPEDRFIEQNKPTLRSNMPSVSDLNLETNNNNNGTTKMSNGDTNGGIIRRESSNITKTKKNGLMRSVFSFTLLLTVLGVMVVASFEANNGRGIGWTKDFSAIASFRQVIYEPSKDYIQQIITRFRSE